MSNIKEVTTIEEFEQELLKNKRLIIYGAGPLGGWIKSHLHKIFLNQEVVRFFEGFCDKKAEELKKVYEEKVGDVSELHGGEVCVFICTNLDEKHATIVHKEVISDFQRHEVRAVCLNVNKVVKRFPDGHVKIGEFTFYDNTYMWLRNQYKDKRICAVLDEYSNAIRPIVKGNSYCLNDYVGEFYNVVNGTRVTVPSVGMLAKKKIHVIGDSRVLSVYTNDEETFCSFLQRLYNEEYQVINYGMQRRSMERMLHQIREINVGKDDIVILATDWSLFYDEMALIYAAKKLKEANTRVIFFEIPSLYEITNKTSYEKRIENELLPSHSGNRLGLKRLFECALSCNGIEYVDCACLINDKRPNSDIFFDWDHYNSTGNKLLAQLIYNEIEKRNAILKTMNSMEMREFETNSIRMYQEGCEKIDIENELKAYAEELRERYYEVTKNKICGCIVMNCNPFTKGHLYLVEKALKEVEHLFLFVLEEDKSYFSFADRYDMVKNNTEMLGNVTVLKSGKFVISSLTFPEYFEKEKMQDAKIDTSTDIMTFAKYIAPNMNIKKRFVGEEPGDKITRQYNEQLKEILPKYNIELVEIPRCMNSKGDYISATNVRRMIKEGKTEELSLLVPSYTYKMILEKYSEVRN